MFTKPRTQRNISIPPSKKRKTPRIEEIAFDDAARQEFLTGFHKRKQQRILLAQQQAAKHARQEKLDTRKQMREKRRRECEEHVESINRLLRESESTAIPIMAGADEDKNEAIKVPPKPDLDMTTHEEGYIDEDRYTTVIVEAVSICRDGLRKPQRSEVEARKEDGDSLKESVETKKKPSRPTKPSKKKFRYENKIEKQWTSKTQKSRFL